MNDCQDTDDDKVFICNCCFAVYGNVQELEGHECSSLDDGPSAQPQPNVYIDHNYALNSVTEEASTSSGDVVTGDNTINIIDNADDTSFNQSANIIDSLDDIIDNNDGDGSGNTKNANDDDDDVSWFHCVQCNHVFHEVDMFRNHTCRKRKRRHRNVNPSKTHACGMCGKFFQKACVLQAHLKIHYASKEFVCKVCSKAFLHRHQLVEHEVIHSSNRPFECEECQASFKRITHLRRHKLTHTGEKSFSCDKCDYKGVSRYAIKRHEITVHTIERPFSCPHCPFSFSENYKLNCHIEKVHGSKKRNKNSRPMVSCLYCDKKFYWRKHLAKHLQYDHAEEYQKLNSKTEIPEDSQETPGISNRSDDPDYVPNLDPVSLAGQLEDWDMSKSKCWFCDKTYSREVSAIRHMKLKHLKAYKKACKTKSENGDA